MRPIGLAALGTLVFAPSGLGQVVAVEDHPHCIGRVAPDAVVRLPILVTAVPLDSAAGAIGPHVELLVESVAIAMRGMLGGSSDVAPAADSALAWHQLGSVRLVVGRDGDFSWRTDTSRLPSLRANPGVQLLERALAAIHSSGERVFVPDGGLTDSATFRLGLVAPLGGPGGLFRPRGSVAFTLPVPKLTPARSISVPTPRYPTRARDGLVSGILTLKFIVDTLGRAIPESISDVWPADRPRLTGEPGGYYRQFVDASKSAVARGKFAPAELGGCRIPQLVVNPFSYTMK